MIGVTLDRIENLEHNLSLLKTLPYRPVVRLVCDVENNPDYYVQPVKLIATAADIIVQPVDSSELAGLSRVQHKKRFMNYLVAFGNSPGVIAFEAGNEINGDWCVEEGSPKEAVNDKVNDAIRLCRANGTKTLVTMFATGLDESPENQPITWLTNNPIAEMDLLSLSVYPLQWALGKDPDVEGIFQVLSGFYPSAKLLVGEFGPEGGARPSDVIKKTLIDYWYTFEPEVANWDGGGFYWDAATDMHLLLPVLKTLSPV